MSEREPDRTRSFVDKLTHLDAGDKARLKRDAGKPLAEAHSLGLFYRILPYGLSAAREEVYFLVATLYPLADGGAPGNLGASLRRARDPQNPKGLDRKVEVLLDADAAQLPFRLRRTILYLRSKRVRVNWPQLLDDLLKWPRASRIVQKQWARAYFATGEDPAKTTAQAAGESDQDQNTNH